MTARTPPRPYIDSDTRRAWQRRLGMTRPLALLAAGTPGSHLDTLRLVAQRLAPAYPGVDFLYPGSLPPAFRGYANLHGGKGLAEAEQALLLACADLAIHAGAHGTEESAWLSDVLASGVPLLCTPGRSRGDDWQHACWCAPPQALSDRLGELLAASPRERNRRTALARYRVVDIGDSHGE